jgi:hypothetical protein
LVSVDELVEKHGSVMKTIVKGCFLDESSTSKSISKVLDSIFEYSNKIEKEIDSFVGNVTPADMKSFKRYSEVNIANFRILRCNCTFCLNCSLAYKIHHEPYLIAF